MGVHPDPASVFQVGKSVGVHSFPPLLSYNGAAKSAWVHSFPPIMFRQLTVRGYTLSRLLYSGTKQCGGTLFPAYCIQAPNSAGVHSFLPIVFRHQTVRWYTLSRLLYSGGKECGGTLFPTHIKFKGGSKECKRSWCLLVPQTQPLLPLALHPLKVGGYTLSCLY